jgi:hypothetical protein
MTQQFLLPCTCGQKVRVGPAQAGGRVACGCGQNVAVPTLRGLRNLEEAPASGPAVTSPGWSRLHGAIFAVSLVAAAAGLGTTGYNLFRYAQAMERTVDLTSTVIDDVAKAHPIDALTPLGALDEWQKEVLPGLRQEVLPEWVAAKMAAAHYFSWVRFGVLLLIGGIVPAIATLYIGRGSRPA